MNLTRTETNHGTSYTLKDIPGHKPMSLFVTRGTPFSPAQMLRNFAYMMDGK